MTVRVSLLVVNIQVYIRELFRFGESVKCAVDPLSRQAIVLCDVIRFSVEQAETNISVLLSNDISHNENYCSAFTITPRSYAYSNAKFT
jgi:hypothetical protein